MPFPIEAQNAILSVDALAKLFQVQHRYHLQKRSNLNREKAAISTAQNILKH